ELGRFGGEFTLKIAVVRVAHLVALERGLPPRKCEAERQRHEKSPEHGPPGVCPAGAVHPEPDAAPDRARQPVAPRAVGRELPERIEGEDQRKAGELLEALDLDAD